MPEAIGKLFTELIQERLIHIVLATSTLSEGVNLPFETILIPSLERWKPGRHWNPFKKLYDEGKNETITQQEFGNLIGRSGRPGYGTEGRSLVVVSSLNNTTYENLINKISPEAQSQNVLVASSPLEEQWSRIVPDSNNDNFYNWLEQTVEPH
ncbi:MAG: hypothetical protein ABI396_19075 [Ktedonobacteraceae bacterium]